VILEFKIELSKMNTDLLNALDAELDGLIERGSKNKVIGLLWKKLKEKVNEEIKARLEPMKGAIRNE
jgi:hypothetical protein